MIRYINFFRYHTKLVNFSLITQTDLNAKNFDCTTWTNNLIFKQRIRIWNQKLHKKCKVNPINWHTMIKVFNHKRVISKDIKLFKHQESIKIKSFSAKSYSNYPTIAILLLKICLV